MRVLSFDPGAKRMGWGVVESGPRYVTSSYSLIDRGAKENYQPYRDRLIRYWTSRTAELLEEHKPDKVVTEIVPPVGFGAGGGNIQAQLATAAIQTVEVVTIVYRVTLERVSATTVKKAIAGNGKATKPKVRDGVLKLLPDLLPRKKEWSGADAVWEETDALAVGLTSLGYSLYTT